MANPNWRTIIEIDASNIGYGGILKQINLETNFTVLMRFTSGKWNFTRYNYSTIKKEIQVLINSFSGFD